MRALSDAFRRKLEQNTTLLTRATLSLRDGAVRELTGDDIVSLSVEHGTSSSNSFDIGAAITGKLSITLNNHDGRFSEYDFTGASIVPYVGAETSPSTVEWLRLGTYTIDQPDAYAGTIALTALDNMSKFERPFSGVPTVFPMSFRALTEAICDHCGITIKEADVIDRSINRRPDSGVLTCKDVISYIAQASGCFARVDELGQLEIRWYDLRSFEGEAWLDGESFDESMPYSSGSSIDGGDFESYPIVHRSDGGTFEEGDRWAHVFAVGSLTVNTDDVVVTGVRVTEQNQITGVGGNGKDGESHLFGSEGYVLTVSDNPLIEYGYGSAFSQHIGKKITGMRFRPFSATCVTDPAIEAGDGVVVTDMNQNSYISYATSVTLSVNAMMRVSCKAKSASRNSVPSRSAATEAIVRARNEVKRERDARDRAIEELQRELSESSGLYSTARKEDGGSYTYYMHDARELERSKVVWRLSADAVGVSTDGGKTYSTAISADGIAILNRIYAVGINADYIKTGTLDASRVNITGLMKIGDAHSNISVNRNSIVFKSGDTGQRGSISSADHIITREKFTGDRGGWIGSSRNKEDSFAPPRYSFTLSRPLGYFYKGTAWSKAKVTYQVYDPSKRGFYTYYGKWVEFPHLNKGTVTLNQGDSLFTFNLDVSDSAGKAMLTAQGSLIGEQFLVFVSIQYTCKYGGVQITTDDDDVFLTKKNFAGSVLNDLYTGEIRVTRAINNSLIQHVLRFTNGLLSSYDKLNAGDEGFIDDVFIG